jgi:hypothetical protein
MNEEADGIRRQAELQAELEALGQRSDAEVVPATYLAAYRNARAEATARGVSPSEADRLAHHRAHDLMIENMRNGTFRSSNNNMTVEMSYGYQWDQTHVRTAEVATAAPRTVQTLNLPELPSPQPAQRPRRR